MKITWKKPKGDKSSRHRPVRFPDLPFDPAPDEQSGYIEVADKSSEATSAVDNFETSVAVSEEANSFQLQGNQLAEEGKYAQALVKWEAAMNLCPNLAILHEQKAQLLLEMNDAWGAIKAATRATELEPSWAEAWLTLGRAQLNFGEPDLSIESFDKALSIKPDSEAVSDRETALQLVQKRNELRSSGMIKEEIRYMTATTIK